MSDTPKAPQPKPFDKAAFESKIGDLGIAKLGYAIDKKELLIQRRESGFIVLADVSKAEFDSLDRSVNLRATLGELVMTKRETAFIGSTWKNYEGAGTMEFFGTHDGELKKSDPMPVPAKPASAVQQPAPAADPKAEPKA